MSNNQPKPDLSKEIRKDLDMMDNLVDELNNTYDILITYDFHEPENGNPFRQVVHDVFELLHGGSPVQNSVFLFRSKQKAFSILEGVVKKIINDYRFKRKLDKILICKISDLYMHPNTSPNPSSKLPKNVLNKQDITKFS